MMMGWKHPFKFHLNGKGKEGIKMLGVNKEGSLFAFNRESLKNHLKSIIMTTVIMSKVGNLMSDEEMIDTLADASIDTMVQIEKKEGTYYEVEGNQV